MQPPQRAVFAVAVFIFAAFAITGCASNRQYRTSYDVSDTAASPATNAVIEATSAYKLGVVEFDDQGSFWDIRQPAKVEEMIRAEAGLGPGESPCGVVIVVFVHGWKNNASYDSDGLVALRAALAGVQLGEQTHTHPRKVVGVYCGWRGLTAMWEPAEELSFWDRKETAHKVGSYGALTRLLVELEEIQKQSLRALPKDTPVDSRTELITVGHSFGGAAVYSAVSQIISERFVQTLGNQNSPKILKPMGDQIILINPAFEAMRHFDLNQMATNLQKIPREQRPVLSIFTSEGDWATHFIFPVGQFFATLFQSNRDDQGAASRTTVGWYTPFITHRLIFKEHVPTTQEAQDLDTPRADVQQQTQVKHARTNIANQRTKWRPADEVPQTYYFYESYMRPEKTYRSGDPILIVKVDKKIMADHNDIKNPRLLWFLSEYVAFCRSDAQSPDPRLETGPPSTRP